MVKAQLGISSYGEYAGYQQIFATPPRSTKSTDQSTPLNKTDQASGGRSVYPSPLQTSPRNSESPLSPSFKIAFGSRIPIATEKSPRVIDGELSKARKEALLSRKEVKRERPYVFSLVPMMERPIQKAFVLTEGRRNFEKALDSSLHRFVRSELTR